MILGLDNGSQICYNGGLARRNSSVQAKKTPRLGRVANHFHILPSGGSISIDT